MLNTRVIPCLLLKDRGLVKTQKFANPNYIGDPINAVKIFNEKEVDELVIFDINASKYQKPIQFELIKEIVSEAFMPIGYGGGVSSVDDALKLIYCGVEKIIINTKAVENPQIIKDLSNSIGNQSVVVCIDVKKNMWGNYEIFTHSGTKGTKKKLIDVILQSEQLGAGEIIINSIDRDGMMKGYDINLLKIATSKAKIPVVACGGAGNLNHLTEAVSNANVSAVCAGSLFVYHGKLNGVLINYPTYKQLEELFRNS